MNKYTNLFLIVFLLMLKLSTASIIVVGSFNELVDAMGTVNSGDTVLMKDGTYNNPNLWSVVVNTNGITVTSQSGNPERVILKGQGMNANDVHHGFWVGADNVTISNITIQDVRNHCIQTDTNTNGLHVNNCILRDAGEQILKVPRGNSDSPSENGLVENCLFEYSAGIGPRYYIGGVDCHFGKNWIVRKNIFKYIRSPEATVAEHAVHFWNSSEGTVVEKNLIIDCDRGIGFGLGSSPHTGGIIRNNMIYHRNISGLDMGDVGIALESSPNTQIYNNTIILEHDYANAIEYRFAATTNVYIVNNLSNKRIWPRDGATGTVSNNVVDAVSSWFVSTATGNLHLSSDDITEVIDQGTDITVLTDDFDSQSRPQGAGIDIGADEYHPISIDFSNANNKNFNWVRLHVIPAGKIKNVITIDLYLSRKVTMTLSIYDMKGKLITQLFSGTKMMGNYTYTWDVTNRGCGIYYCVLKMVNIGVLTSKKIIVIPS